MVRPTQVLTISEPVEPGGRQRRRSAARRARRGRAATIGLAVALAVAGSAAAGSHTVRRGETLGGIAARNGTTTAALVAANGLGDPDRIRVGQVLRLGPAVPEGHVVRTGETLGGIAARYGTTVAALVAANGIGDPNRVAAGSRLLLAARGPAPVVAGPTVHVVRPGETLGGIAARNGTTTGALVAANGIADPNRLRAGTRLTIAGAGWRCPVPGARFTNDWGFARPGGRWHEGTDLLAPRGAAVLAPVAGTVTQRLGPVAGRQVELLGDDGTWYVGTHLEAFGETGRVAAGTRIGAVGNSGNAGGGPTHLHFEVHPGGRGSPAANPHPLLAAACG